MDHAVINVRDDMDRAVERFGALGFTLTERGYHSLGSINHLMVFDADYLELVGLPVRAARVRREIAESPVGLNGLVFATADAARLHDRLAARGVPMEPVVAFDRPVTLDGIVQRASFRTVRLAPGYAQGGRVYFCEHETPHLVWRREWQRHRNGVHGLAEFTLVLPEPAREAARYAEITGAAPRPRASDEIELAFRACTVRLVTPGAYQARYGACAADPGGRDAFMGALALRTSALARVRECLAAASEAFDVQGRPARRITLGAASAYNTVLEFVE
ncbi:MAG: VOC family protein [Rudaea sp.]